ncbi:MAG: hypothetical protein US32_C0028G0010 [candidate division TM6 bacterium GW2011_GWA2_36_9]|nr:MAG: hypothetical protein US32_C0028G0010 [candidate division TM6 bacterium GW2011_GWA2_36_9]
MPMLFCTRSRISWAALLVNVNAIIEVGVTFSVSIRLIMRLVITRVLPEPAPAITRRGPFACLTAFCCSLFNSVDKNSAKSIKLLYAELV